MDEHDVTTRAREYWPRLIRTARLLTGDSADAESLARAALTEMYARRRGVPSDDAEFYVRRALVRGYLRRSRSERLPFARGHLRRSRRQRLPFARSGHAPKSYVPDELDPLTEALAALSPRRRAVAVLHHWDGLPHREIAALLDSSPGAVKAHRRRALKTLRAHPAYNDAPRIGSPPVPDPVLPPLPAIEEAGRTRRRRRRRTTAALTTACALLLVPLVLGAVRGTGSGPNTTSTPAARTAVRVVTAGERVAAAPGVELWLTKDGKHWSTPKQSNQFHPAGEGKSPTLTVQSDPASGERHFLSGVYRGAREPSRIELTTDDGEFTARVLTLAGTPGWSVWYADTQLPGSKGLLDPVTVKAYDSTGKLLARTATTS
jgi:RNA polymerase sigma factor (sigma-70 family)